jgi:putative transposase
VRQALPGCSMSRICAVLHVSRSSLQDCAPRHGVIVHSRSWKPRFNCSSKEHPSYGYRRLWALLKYRLGLNVNRKRIYQLFEAQTLVGASKGQNTAAASERLGESHLQEQSALGDGPDACELQCRRMGSPSGSHRLLRSRVGRLGVRHPRPSEESRTGNRRGLHQEIRHAASTGGGTAAAKRQRPDLSKPTIPWRLSGLPTEARVRHPYTLEQNGIIERFFCSLKEECVWQKQFKSFAEAKREISQWIEWYNAGRPHQSLGNMSPREYRTHLSESVA